ncbi:MbcA/ParS/Xre antitoxin family protein [Saccharospirillum salsuginis]|uniref:Antitoxin Xre/MbcA/ParS-like toxin-binding domain-containing protein n=1 Tax=Saccharospirillum salsuginis TaxID=418750 RepID=A0A918N6T1_9GAMM|nr:MbcA/ParS/Xre antitoxin family protein [Saccharospirillum salsuginis]GGX40573.1 hypothetical protein GCM10007392_04160 [Saccharospirillum salsuginis]
MLHHFTLTFSLPEASGMDAHSVANEIPGADFTVERLGFNPAGEFTIHFSREGASVMDVLEYAKAQVQQAFPKAQLVSMELAEEPPAQGMVDDISKLVLHACKVLGSVDAAQAWLSTPNAELDSLTPKALMVDAEGRMRVSRLLTKKMGISKQAGEGGA